VGEFSLDRDLIAGLAARTATPRTTSLPDIDATAVLVHDLLGSGEVRALTAQIDAQEWVAVGLNGIQADYRPHIDRIGSYRASCYEPAFAEVLWSRLAPLLPAVRTMADDTPTDWDGWRHWRPVAVSPLLRFIRYLSGGLLVPHYDAPFVVSAQRRTLTTLVLYLGKDDTATGGATRFLGDPQQLLPLSERDYADWDRLARPADVAAAVQPNEGAALLFDHRILHDSEPITGTGTKTILRTDIVYERYSGGGG
jgi:hypothetical protein